MMSYSVIRKQMTEICGLHIHVKMGNPKTVTFSTTLKNSIPVLDSKN